MVIILFRGTSLKYFTDLIACLLLCFVCVSRKACIVRTFLVYSANGIGNLIFQRVLRNLTFHKNQEFHFPPIFQESLSSENLGNRLFSGTRVNLIASNISENSLKLLTPLHCIPRRCLQYKPVVRRHDDIQQTCHGGTAAKECLVDSPVKQGIFITFSNNC